MNFFYTPVYTSHLSQLILAITTCLCLFVSSVNAEEVKSQEAIFTDAFDGSPIKTPLKDGEEETPALKEFKATSVNPYLGNEEAIAKGKAVYEAWCVACHDVGAKGKMGPSLVGKTFKYPQTANDVGMFAVIYNGASGAMQAFSKREITQDEILKLISYIRSITPQ